MTILPRIRARWRDYVLEFRIDAAMHRYWMTKLRGEGAEARVEAWDEFARLVAQRSPAQVERIERARGTR